MKFWWEMWLNDEQQRSDASAQILIHNKEFFSCQLVKCVPFTVDIC